MKRIDIDPTLRGKALFEFLKANKAAIVAQKKSLPKFATALQTSYETFVDKEGKLVSTKGAAGVAPVEISADATAIDVTIVGNASRWFDSQQDVLFDDCWKKSISEGNGRLHLHDHIFKIEAEVGEVQDISAQMVNLSDLGLAQGGATQCVVYKSKVMKEMNEGIFNKYRKKRIQQHSIGLRYVKIELAINDSEYEKEMDFWNKYYPLIINKADVDEYGYFWVVTEIQLIEVSAVLAGANKLTPTLDISESTDDQPEESTDTQPQKTSEPDGPRWEKMADTLFKN